MKTLSEQLREFMDAIDSIAPTPEQPNMPKYDYKFTINTWIPMPDDDEAEWDEEREVGVKGAIAGGYYAGSRYEPPEAPEVDLQHVYDLKTGEDVVDLLPRETIEQLESAYLHAAEEAKRNRDY